MNYIIALLVTSQLLIVPFLGFRWVKEVSAQYIIIMAIASLIWKKNRYISLFVLWSLFLFIITRAYIGVDTINGTDYRINLMAFFNIINIVLYGLLYYVLHRIVLDHTKLYKTFCFIAVFQTAYIFLQRLNLDQFFYHLSGIYGEQRKYSWCVGTWANESLVGWCIALCSPFFLFFKEFRYKVGYFLSFIALLFCQASASIVAFITGFLIWLWFQNKKIATAVILLCFFGGIFLIGEGKIKPYLEDSHRFKVWKKTIDLWANGSGDPSKLDRKTITGYGLGSFRQQFATRAPEFQKDGYWAQTHNEYLQILFEQGIVGLGIILCLMFTTLRKFLTKQKGLIPFISLVIFSILAVLGFPARTAMFALVIVAFVLWEKENGETV